MNVKLIVTLEILLIRLIVTLNNNNMCWAMTWLTRCLEFWLWMMTPWLYLIEGDRILAILMPLVIMRNQAKVLSLRVCNKTLKRNLKLWYLNTQIKIYLAYYKYPNLLNMGRGLVLVIKDRNQQRSLTFLNTWIILYLERIDFLLFILTL